MGLSKLALCAFGVYVVYRIIEHIRSSIAASRCKAAHGCLPPPALPQRERILGFDILKELAIATKNKNALELGQARFAANSNTHSNVVAGLNFLTTTEPANLQALLATKFEDFDLGGRIYAWGPLIGKGIFTSDGAPWAHRRALLRPNFHKQQCADLDMFEKHVQHLISLIPLGQETFDLQKLFFSMTLDSATEFLFGQSVGAQGAAESSEAANFEQAFDFAQHKLPNRNRLGKLNLLVRDSKFDAACNIVRNWADRYIGDFLEAQKAGKCDEEKADKGGKYVFLNEIAKAVPDPKQLRDDMLNVLLAGRDTTAGLLSNIFHALARHPQAWEQLRAEVSSLEGSLPTYDDLKNMKYLNHVLKEGRVFHHLVSRGSRLTLYNAALRLYPPVPTNARWAKRNTVLPTGGGPDGKSPVYVAKGTIVAYSAYSLHRRTDIYGSNAGDFVPERWAHDAPGGPLRPGWGYIPFNGGPRICVGQQYALTEAGYAIVRLCQIFKGLEYRDQGPWKEGLGLTLCSGEGTKVALTLA
jgi:cytochrome P450